MPATTEWPWPEKGGSYIRDKTTGKLTPGCMCERCVAGARRDGAG